MFDQYKSTSGKKVVRKISDWVIIGLNCAENKLQNE